MKRVLVINGNPDPAPERLSSALAQAYGKGAAEGNCEVQRLDIARLDFPLLRTTAQFLAESPAQDIRRAQAAFLTAEHVAFIYPLWLGGPPALLKGFMEQLGCNQFLLQANNNRFPRGGLKGRSASVIVTMGMPPLIYRTWFGGHGVKAFNSGILRLAGFSPIRTHLFGGRAITAPHSMRLVQKARQLGQRLG